MDSSSYRGFIASTDDALLMFEACRQNILPRRKHRLNENERNKITSGSIFVWDETESGIRRWTDGRRWSPSRVAGCFLSYIELKPRPHEKEHSTVRLSYKHSYSGVPDMVMEDGLVKKTLSLFTTNNHKLHIICYYRKKDVDDGLLTEPSRDPRLRSIVIPQGLYPDFLSNTACVEPPRSLPFKKRNLSTAPFANGSSTLNKGISQRQIQMLPRRQSPLQNQQGLPMGYQHSTTLDRFPDRLQHNQISHAHTIQGASVMMSPYQQRIVPISHSARTSPSLISPLRTIMHQQRYGDTPSTQSSSGNPSSTHARTNHQPNYRSQSNPVPQDNESTTSYQPLSAPSDISTNKRKTMADVNASQQHLAPVPILDGSIKTSSTNNESNMKLPSVSELLSSIGHKRRHLQNEDTSKIYPAGLAQTAYTRITNNNLNRRQSTQDISGVAR